jgi:hypothetical protein
MHFIVLESTCKAADAVAITAGLIQISFTYSSGTDATVTAIVM